MIFAFLIIPALALVLYLVHRFTKQPIFRYMFFLRVPIISALFLVGYPMLAGGVGKLLLANTLVILSGWGMFFVVLVGVLIAGMVQLVTMQIVENAPKRFEVPPLGASRVVRVLVTTWWTLPLLLPIPLLWSLYVNSYTLSTGTRLMSITGAVLVGLVLIGLVNLRTLSLDITNRMAGLTARIFGEDSAFTEGYVVKKGDKIVAEPGHAKLLGLTMVVVLIYGAIGLTIQPPHVTLPALFFVFFLVLLLGFLMAGITFFLDFFRIPAMLFLLVALVLVFNLSRVDHFYKLSPADEAVITKEDRNLLNQASKAVQRAAKMQRSKEIFQQERVQLPDTLSAEDSSQILRARDKVQALFVEALRNRLADQPVDNRTLVVVGASGGGIQAAGWTAQVLSGLYLHPDFGPEFVQAIGMISSVSGGSMGSMFFVDRLQALEAARGNREETVALVEAMRQGAMGNALDATAWGINYPDLLRVLGFAGFLNPLEDRAYSLESFLASQMAHGDARLLADWRPAIIKGELPTTVFNATLVESGDRYLLSPMDFPTAIKGRAFTGLYNGFDMEAVTAARLSATFPYVTPIARPYFQGDAAQPDCVGDNVEDCYHVADGGFFDNFGVFTIVEWLDSIVLPANDQGLNIRRVIFIEINAFPSSDVSPSPLPGVSAAIAGPVMTLLNVRNSTQIARNKAEIGFLSQVWGEQGVDVDYVDLRFTLDGEPTPCPEIYPDCPSVMGSLEFDQYEPPLSWKLSPREREAICQAWVQMSCGDGLSALDEAWNGGRATRATTSPAPPQDVDGDSF